VAFEAAQGLDAALAFGFSAGEVVGGRAARAALHDRDPVQGAVELAVAASVEPVSLPATRGSRDRGDAGMAGEVGLAREALDVGRLGEDLGRGQGAAALQREQLRGAPSHESAELGFQARALARELARHPHPRLLVQPGEPPADALQPAQPVQRPGRDVQLRDQIVQVPAQSVLHARALADQVLAVVEQQLDLKRPLVELGAGQTVDALPERGAGDRLGVDRV
jgi:hypothetical protein